MSFKKQKKAKIQEYRITQWLALKFDGMATTIYVKDKPFRQCKYLLVDIPMENIHEYRDITSIDDVAQRLDRSLERGERHSISPKEEFWGHCSNLQAWAEHNYDTRLLHSNLAFPLLKKLTEAGDPKAKNIFTEEIARRLQSGAPQVAEFLISQGYLNHLTPEELESLFLDIMNLESLSNIVIIPILRKLMKAGSGKILTFFEQLLEKKRKQDFLEIIEYLKDSVYSWSKRELNELFQKIPYGLFLHIDDIKSIALLSWIYRNSTQETRKYIENDIKPLITPHKWEGFKSVIFQPVPILQNRFYSVRLKVVNEMWKLGLITDDMVKRVIFKGIQSNTLETVKEIVRRKYLELFSENEKSMVFRRIQRQKIEEMHILEFIPSIIYLTERGYRYNSRKVQKLKQIARRIKILFAENNNITHLPSNLHVFSPLFELYLDNNSLETIPESIRTLPSLKELSLQSNKLKTLPQSIGELTALKHLNIESNSSLRKLPESIGNLKNLQFLNGSYCDLHSIPESIGKMTSLQKLQLANNNLTSLPKSMGNLKNLTVLDLDFNRIEELPNWVSRLQSLRVLCLMRNKIRSLPASIGTLKHIEVLELSQNQLKQLPEVLGGLSSLNELSLFGNKLTKLPHSISNLKALKKLNLADNNLKKFPMQILDLSSLSELSLTLNDFSTIPEEINKLKFLERLSIGNKITHLPSSLEDLTSLRELFLDTYKIDSSFEIIGTLKITDLTIKIPNLKEIPNIIFKLVHLKKLAIRHSNLSSIPSHINRLGQLENLGVSDNQLEDLPISCKDLHSIKSLDISNNNFHILPEAIKFMDSLEELILSGNPLQSLPVWLVQLPSLIRVELFQDLNDQGSIIHVISQLEERGVYVHWEGE
mgnify:CR=1 FL=1